MATRGQRLNLRRGLLFNTDGHRFELRFSSGFQRQERKSAVADDHPKGHALLYKTAARCRHKLQQLVNFRARTDLCLNLLESLRRIKLRPRKQAKRLVERFDAISR